MENDMANYYQYKMGFSQKIILKDKVLPSKFHCQPDRIKRTYDAIAGTSRSAFVKRQRMDLVEQCLNNEDIQQTTITNDGPTATVVETCSKGMQLSFLIVLKLFLHFQSFIPVNLYSNII